MVLGQGFEPMDFRFPKGNQKNAIVPLLHRAPHLQTIIIFASLSQLRKWLRNQDKPSKTNINVYKRLDGYTKKM